MTVRAKFRCTQVAHNEGGSTNVRLSAVTSGSEENKSFFKSTPYANAELNVLSEEAAATFEPGVEYYVDFTRAPKPE